MKYLKYIFIPTPIHPTCIMHTVLPAPARGLILQFVCPCPQRNTHRNDYDSFAHFLLYLGLKSQLVELCKLQAELHSDNMRTYARGWPRWWRRFRSEGDLRHSATRSANNLSPIHPSWPQWWSHSKHVRTAPELNQREDETYQCMVHLNRMLKMLGEHYTALQEADPAFRLQASDAA